MLEKYDDKVDYATDFITRNKEESSVWPTLKQHRIRLQSAKSPERMKQVLIQKEENDTDYRKRQYFLLHKWEILKTLVCFLL